MEYLSQFEYKIHYVKGEDNTVANALSQLEGDDSPNPEPPSPISAIFSITSDPELIKSIKAGYEDDPFTSKIMKDIKSKMITPSSGIEIQDGLLYLGQCLAIPQTSNLWESLYSLAHDSLGHVGGDKSYAALWNDYYWPHIHSNLVNVYIPSCESCQCNKSQTSLPTGPLHPLPVTGGRLEGIALDFVGPLPRMMDTTAY